MDEKGSVRELAKIENCPCFSLEEQENFRYHVLKRRVAIERDWQEPLWLLIGNTIEVNICKI